MLREKICNFNDVDKEKFEEAKIIMDKILNTEFDGVDEETIYYDFAQKKQETLNHKPANPEDMNMANGNEHNGNGTAQAQQNDNPAPISQEVTTMANGNEHNGNDTAQAQQEISNHSTNAQEVTTMANGSEQNSTSQAQQNNTPAPISQEVTIMANGNEHNGNGMAQAQQNNATRPLNAQEVALFTPGNARNGNGTAQGQQSNASQVLNGQEGVKEATEQEREERSAARVSKADDPKENFQYRVRTVHGDYLNGVHPKITRKKLNVSKADYRDLFYAVCMIYGVDWEMPSEASTVRKATTSENGILVSKYNIETLGAGDVFAEGTVTIPSYDAANKRIIISLYNR